MQRIVVLVTPSIPGTLPQIHIISGQLRNQISLSRIKNYTFCAFHALGQSLRQKNTRGKKNVAFSCLAVKYTRRTTQQCFFRHCSSPSGKPYSSRKAPVLRSGTGRHVVLTVRYCSSVSLPRRKWCKLVTNLILIRCDVTAGMGHLS